MKDGIYEQLLNNELKSKLNESEFFYKTNTILKSPENAKKLITEYLKEVTRKAMDCIQENNIYLCAMKKEFGKWLMDIAKYITTAVILTSIFGEIEQKWIIYAGGIVSISLTLGIGLWLVRDNKEKGK